MPQLSDFDFPSSELSECPFPFYDALRREAPVHQLPGRGEYVVSRWEDIAYVAQHPELFARRPSVEMEHRPEGYDFDYAPVSMAGSDLPEHRVKRLAGLKLISRERMRDYEPMVRAIVNELIDGFVDRGEVEFASEFADWLPIRVIAEVLGLPRDDAPLFKQWGDNEGEGMYFLTGTDDWRVYAERHAAQAAYLEAAVLDRYERPRDDGLSELVRGQVERDGRLNLTFLASETAVLLFAGNVTTTHLMASMMQLLLEQPLLLERIVSDGSLIEPLVEETLRLESPVQWNLRFAKQDAVVGGVEIPTDSPLVIVWQSGNRDEAKWECPVDLRLDRPEIAKHHLAFGRGIHLCLGAPLARLEACAGFEIFLSRVRNIRAAPGKNDFGHALYKSCHMRAPKAVHLQFDQRR